MYFLWELVYPKKIKTLARDGNSTNFMPLADTESHPLESSAPIRLIFFSLLVPFMNILWKFILVQGKKKKKTRTKHYIGKYC